METIQDFLIICNKRYSNGLTYNTKLELEITEVKDNQFYLPFKGDDRKHWRIEFVPYYFEDEESNEWMPYNDISKLYFYMTSYKKPTIKDVSNHIKTECLNLLNALEIDLSDCYIWDLDDRLRAEREYIEPKNVYKFLKNIHKDYTKTEDFLRDYEHYKNRIYHTIKFIRYLTFGDSIMFCMSWDYPIGEHFLAFLGEGKFSDYYEKINN